jgi:hypothetical protein
VPRHLVALVVRADPIDRLPVLVVPTIDLNRLHSHMLLEQEIDYPVGPKAMLPVEAEPMDRETRVHPTVAVPLHFLNLEHPTQQVVVELGFACPTLRPVVVERGSVRPTGRVVEQDFVPSQEFVVEKRQVVVELGFACPTLRPVEQDFVPSQEFVVEERQVVRPTLRPVVVEQDFVHPTLLVVVEHPMHWVVVLVDSKNLHLAYFQVGSTPAVELVVPDVANPKMPQHLPFSSFRYCGRVVVPRPELWLLLPEQQPL